MKQTKIRRISLILGVNPYHYDRLTNAGLNSLDISTLNINSISSSDSARQRQQRPTPTGPTRQSSQGAYTQQQGAYRPNKYVQPANAAPGDQFAKQFPPNGRNFSSNYGPGMYSGMQTSPGKRVCKFF